MTLDSLLRQNDWSSHEDPVVAARGTPAGTLARLTAGVRSGLLAKTLSLNGSASISIVLFAMFLRSWTSSISDRRDMDEA